MSGGVISLFALFFEHIAEHMAVDARELGLRLFQFLGRDFSRLPALAKLLRLFLQPGKLPVDAA